MLSYTNLDAQRELQLGYRLCLVPVCSHSKEEIEVKRTFDELSDALAEVAVGLSYQKLSSRHVRQDEGHGLFCVPQVITCGVHTRLSSACVGGSLRLSFLELYFDEHLSQGQAGRFCGAAIWGKERAGCLC